MVILMKICKISIPIHIAFINEIVLLIKFLCCGNFLVFPD